MGTCKECGALTGGARSLCGPCFQALPVSDNEIRAIAMMCQRKGIYEPLEETVRTHVEASNVIRQLRRA